VPCVTAIYLGKAISNQEIAWGKESDVPAIRRKFYVLDWFMEVMMM
jgi:hypothetical protein